MTSATATPLQQRPALARQSESAARGHQWRWLLAGLTLSFSIPFVFTDLASIDRDLYYGIYIVGVFGFVAAWLGCCVGSPGAVLARHWRSGVSLGLVFAAVLVAIVRNEPATAHPGGLDFAAAIAWRGVLYGLADGVLLSAFPILAVFAAFAGGHALDRRRGKLAVGALALGVSLLFTAVYHLGYSDFRGEKLRKPLVGDLVWSVPTLATLSPLGAPIAHAGLHVGAVVHSYETDVFLPPHAAGLDPAPLQLLLEQAVSGPNRLAPGATAFVSTPAGSWSGAAGVANLATRAPITPDARMRLESVSKIYTATIIHQLAEEGELELGDTLEKWLPGRFPYGREVTLEQLLTHTSGIVDDNVFVSRFDHYLSLIEDPKLRADVRAEAARQTANPALEFSTDLLVRIAAALPPLFPPGSQYHYSNTGFLVLGLIASRATGKNMPTLYRERIFDPLGLDQTAWDPQGPIDGPHAQAYRRNPDGTLTDATSWHGGKGADGAVVSNAVETARFLTALMRGELLGRRQLDVMKVGGFWSGGDQTGCAGPAYGHSGAGAAFKTNVWVSGDGNRVAVLLLNGRRDDATDMRAGNTMATLYCAAGDEGRP
jgi:CubicO group peptidase (beta-lactamase class C family)